MCHYNTVQHWLQYCTICFILYNIIYTNMNCTILYTILYTWLLTFKFPLCSSRLIQSVSDVSHCPWPGSGHPATAAARATASPPRPGPRQYIAQNRSYTKQHVAQFQICDVAAEWGAVMPQPSLWVLGKQNLQHWESWRFRQWQPTSNFYRQHTRVQAVWT